MNTDQLVDDSNSVVIDVFLAWQCFDEIAFWVDDTDRRPRFDPICLPDLALGVIDDRMVQLIALHGFFDTFRVFFIVEFGSMDADDDDLVGILLLQPDQVGEEVQAVNSAQRPEFEDDDFAAQVLEFDRLIRTESRADSAVKLRGF